MTHTMSYNNQNQDWAPVIIQGGRAATTALPVTQRSAGAAAMLRVENDEKPHIRYLSTESVAILQEWRRNASKTQRELDVICSFPAGTIGDFEGRRRAPSSKQLSDLSRAVKSVLTLDK
jgi:hypothetical protein